MDPKALMFLIMNEKSLLETREVALGLGDRRILDRPDYRGPVQLEARIVLTSPVKTVPSEAGRAL